VRSRRSALAALAALPAVCGVLLAGCATGTAVAGGPEQAVIAPGESGTVDVDGRPFELAVPVDYDAAGSAPLLVLLHGLGSNPERVDAFWPLRAAAAAHGALFALPQGTTADDGRRFWNAGDACCDFDRSGVDDSTYLADVITEISRTYVVDPARVAVVGYSNGGFMAYRMACEHADLVSHVVVTAGAAPADPARCEPVEPVDVLHVHGTDDPVIEYDGGNFGLADYPSAADSVAAWARLDGCDTGPADHDETIDVDVAIPGAETSVTTYDGCADDARVELWSVGGADHGPSFGLDFAEAVLEFITNPVG
jgi:polyhydroxybutyrate depolymerase